MLVLRRVTLGGLLNLTFGLVNGWLMIDYIQFRCVFLKDAGHLLQLKM